MDSLADRLAKRTLELVDIPSESLHEAEIRERLRASGVEVHPDGTLV